MKPPITIKEFETIYRVVSTVGEEFAHGVGRSCQFYNVSAAFILSEVFKVKARPVMGSAFILLDSENMGVIGFGEIIENNCFSNEDAFHCWVETEDYILDFTSPEYCEISKPLNEICEVQRKIFQKPKHLMASSFSQFPGNGSFHFEVNKPLTNFLIRNFMATPKAGDLANICVEWVRQLQNESTESFKIGNDIGEIFELHLKKPNITGAW